VYEAVGGFMKRMALCLAGILPLAFAVGCGQKGPLYLPPKNGTVVTRPAGGTETPPQTTNQSASPQDATTQGAKQPPDKNDKDSSTSQTPKSF
jgi:predicted small lipoprotein YifL